MCVIFSLPPVTHHSADADGVDADVITASQHPCHSCAAIFPTVRLTSGRRVRRSIPHPVYPLLGSLLLLSSPTQLTHRVQRSAHRAPLLLKLSGRLPLFLRRILHVWMRKGKWCCSVTKDRKNHQAAEEIQEGGTTGGSWRCFEWAGDSPSAAVESELLR